MTIRALLVCLPFMLSNAVLGLTMSNSAIEQQDTIENPPIDGATLYEDINYAIGFPQDQLQLDIYVPNGGQPTKPVMIYVHGGSWRIGDKANTAQKDEFFTNLDYIFVSINYRLSPDPINLEDPERVKFPVHPQDVAQAIGWIFDHMDQYGGDLSRVSLMGHSAGAHLVALVATDASYLAAEGLALHQIKCVCSLDAGAYDIPHYLLNYENPGSNQWNNYVNAFGADIAVWQAASPITYISSDQGIPAFLIVHQGTNQRIDLATRFGDELIDHGVDRTMLNAFPLNHAEINGAIGNESPQVQVYNDSIANFFDNCLNNVISTTTYPIKSEQPISVFPNPTSNSFSISSSQAFGCSIYNAVGKLLEVFPYPQLNNTYDISQYPDGIYFIKVATAESIQVKQLVKQKFY